MDESESEDTAGRVRRRASRQAGPAGEATTVTATVPTTESKTVSAKAVRPVGPPPRRPAHAGLVAVVAMVAGLIGVLVLGGLVALLVVQQRHTNAANARNQRFIDTATQTLVNMYTFTQDTVVENVKRFVDSTSGPLHDMMSQPGSIENLTNLLRATGGQSEVAVNGRALEGIDEVRGNASVLVAVRVTPSDIDGNNQPSTAYRFRVIVHEDADKNMTVYELIWPNGGN